MAEGYEELDDQERHLMKHRELFLSRQVETVPATHIRGKCSVTLLNETESVKSYLQREVNSSPPLSLYMYTCAHGFFCPKMKN